MKKEFIKIGLLTISGIFYCANIIAQDFEVSPVNLEFNVEPGQTQTIPINIINHASQKNTFTIQLGDFVINKEGIQVNMPQATTEHSLVNWMSVNPPLLELNPNEVKQVLISIQAPAGDYSTRWAHIFITNTIEQTASIADKALKTGVLVQGQIVIVAKQSPRSNINYKMKINTLLEETSTVDSLRIFSTNVDNIGDKIANCKVILLASDLSNAKETKIDEIKFESYPDSNVKIKLKMSKNALPPGKYALAAILDYGDKANLEGTQIIFEVK
jgi:hypothetical protein